MLRHRKKKEVRLNERGSILHDKRISSLSSLAGAGSTIVTVYWHIDCYLESLSVIILRTVTNARVSFFG